jgi:phosphopantetheinyl transferase (holo-ACP synthase)
VFCGDELEALEASRSRHLLHWALWAAKESAFKARKRLDPGVVFSPREFEIDLSPLPPEGGRGVAVGRALHRGHVFGIEVHVDGACLHAVARGEAAGGARVLWGAEAAAGDPGVAARRLAAAAIGAALGLDTAHLQIVRRPPVATFRDGRLGVEVSLSHHGRFVAFACALAEATPS